MFFLQNQTPEPKKAVITLVTNPNFPSNIVLYTGITSSTPNLLTIEVKNRVFSLSHTTHFNLDLNINPSLGTNFFDKMD